MNEPSPSHRADIFEVIRDIPHRYPFLLIDRVEGCVPHEWVRAVKNVSLNDHFFAGVPPDSRVMPQMLLVEALAQTAGVLCHFSGLLDGPGRPLMLLAGVDDCHFGRDARPGDQLRLECRMHRLIRGIVKMTGDILIDEELALKARLTAATRQTI